MPTEQRRGAGAFRVRAATGDGICFGAARAGGLVALALRPVEQSTAGARGVLDSDLVRGDGAGLALRRLDGWLEATCEGRGLLERPPSWRGEVGCRCEGGFAPSRRASDGAEEWRQDGEPSREEGKPPVAVPSPEELSLARVAIGGRVARAPSAPRGDGARLAPGSAALFPKPDLRTKAAGRAGAVGDDGRELAGDRSPLDFGDMLRSCPPAPRERSSAIRGTLGESRLAASAGGAFAADLLSRSSGFGLARMSLHLAM